MLRPCLSAIPPLALLAPLLLALQSWPGAAEAWRLLRRRFEQGAWWEPVSAQFVHLSLEHALANAAALLMLAWLLRSMLGSMTQLSLLAGAIVGVALQLALDADCAYYAGFSGALHGWLGGSLAMLCWPRLPGCSVIGCSAAMPWPLGLLALLLLKVGLEMTGLLPSAWDFPVYYPSHAAGLAGGLCAAGIIWLSGRLRAASQARQQRG